MQITDNPTQKQVTETLDCFIGKDGAAYRRCNKQPDRAFRYADLNTALTDPFFGITKPHRPESASPCSWCLWEEALMQRPAPEALKLEPDQPGPKQRIDLDGIQQEAFRMGSRTRMKDSEPDEEAPTNHSANTHQAEHKGDAEEVSGKANIGILTIRKANIWIKLAKQFAIPNMLFDAFWYEMEICILFAESNQGKSILAVQILDSISKGVPIRGFRFEAKAQPSIYFDFEMNAKVFEKRYSKDYQDHYCWSDNFYRVEINPDADIPDKTTFEEYLNQSIEQAILKSGAKILCIDNLTYLQNETEKAKEAAVLMKYLKALKNKYGLSILILAHTPKRDPSRPITRNDLMGSSRLNQFADSMFAIGASARDVQLKYVKQIKVRMDAFTYDSDNVVTVQIHQPGNFLMLDFVRYDRESEHLKASTDKDTESRKQKAHELKAKNWNNSQIARELGISEGAVRKYFKT